jgi:hypothetical protein
MEKRHQERKGVSKMVAEISKGRYFYSVNIRNISHSGLVIEDVPFESKDRGEIFNITLSSNDKIYRLRAIPRWVYENEHNKTIGFRIYSVPRNWFQFVDSL